MRQRGIRFVGAMTVAGLAVVGLGTGSSYAAPVTVDFAFTGAAQTWEVPAGVMGI